MGKKKKEKEEDSFVIDYLSAFSQSAGILLDSAQIALEKRSIKNLLKVSDRWVELGDILWKLSHVEEEDSEEEKKKTSFGFVGGQFDLADTEIEYAEEEEE